MNETLVKPPTEPAAEQDAFAPQSPEDAQMQPSQLGEAPPDFSLLAEEAQPAAGPETPEPSRLDAAKQAAITGKEAVLNVANTAANTAKNVAERVPVAPHARFAGRVAVLAMTRSPGVYFGKKVARAGYNSLRK